MDVEVGDVHDVMSLHEWVGVRPWGQVANESNESFLGSDQWLEVALVWFV